MTGWAGMTGLVGHYVLVVEDDYLIATDVADVLISAGAIPIGPFGWEEDALAAAQDRAIPLDFAILDVDLHGTTSYRVADALAARLVPIVFTTGFEEGVIAAQYQCYPRLEKPVSQRALLVALMSQR